MPVARTDPRRALVIALGAVVAAAALVFLSVALAGGFGGGAGGGRIGGGGGKFELGSAERRAESVARHGPLLFQDPVSRQRPIYVNHLGRDPKEGWVAFNARVGDCVLEWDAKREEFGGCGPVRYPPDGGDRPRYGIAVDDGQLAVDFSPDDEEETTTTSSIPRTGNR